MSSHISRIVLLDGVRIPVHACSCTWQAGGMSAEVIIPGTPESREILPSTRVDIFDVETGRSAFRRVAIPLEEDYTPDAGDVRANAPQCVETIGERFLPEWPLDPNTAGQFEDIAEFVPAHGVTLRMTGEVTNVSSSVTVSGNAVTTLSVSGTSYLMDNLRALNMVSGARFRADEIRFMGQENPVFATGNRGRNFAAGIEEVLTRNGNLPAALREIMVRYTGRVNSMWRRRFWRTRLPQQFFCIDEDDVVDRILGTSAGKRVVKETLQSSMEVPLSGLFQTLLSIVGYGIYTVPSPFYVPLYPVTPPPAPARASRPRSRTQSNAVVTIPVGQPFIASGVFPGTIERQGDRRSVAVWLDYTPQEPPPALTVTTRRLARFSLPRTSETAQSGRPDALGLPPIAELAGGALSDEVSAAVAESFVSSGTVESVPFSRFSVEVPDESGTVRLVSVPCQALVSVSTRRLPPPAPRPDAEAPAPQAPPPEMWQGRDGTKHRGVARLHTYTMLPALWWACPPACNIIYREQLLTDAFPPSLPVNAPTRAIGKVSPGISAGGVVSLEHFVAPNRADLNGLMADTDDHPSDARGLAPYEYVYGAVPRVIYFEHLSRLVRQEEYRDYLRSKVVQSFWSERLAPRQKTFSIKYDARLVLGPAVILLKADPPEIDPDRILLVQELTHRLRLLTALKKSLQRCRSRTGTGAAATLRNFIASVYNYLVILVNAQKYANETFTAQNVALAGAVNYSSLVGRLGAFRVTEDERGLVPFETLLGRDRLGDAGSIAIQPTAITPEMVRTFLGATAGALEAVAATGTFPDGIPSKEQLRIWYNQIGPRISELEACRAALSRDLDTVAAAITDTRADLRATGRSTSSASALLCYITSISESIGVDGQLGMQVAYTHGRYVGEDLDFDMQEADDPENTVVFGETAYMDERYSTGRIGPEVYLPMLGCTSIASLPEVQDVLSGQTRAAAGEEESSSLETMASLFNSLSLDHPAVCGHSCMDEIDAATGLSRTADAVAALLDLYQGAVERGDDLFAWFETLKARPGLTLADAYRTAPVSLAGSETAGTQGVDFTESDTTIYGGGDVVEGFFSGSDVPEDPTPDDWQRIGHPVLTSDFSAIAGTEDLPEAEKDLLQARARKIAEFLRSCQNKTILH